MHAREHAPGYKTAFPVPRAHGLDFFQNNSHDSNLGQSPDECMAIPMLKPTVQRHKMALIFKSRKMLVFRRSTSLGHVVDVNADVYHVLFCVGNLASLNKVYCSYGKVVFQCVTLL